MLIKKNVCRSIDNSVQSLFLLKHETALNNSLLKNNLKKRDKTYMVRGNREGAIIASEISVPLR